MSDTLSRLDELHRRYNGPVPPGLLAVARHGSLDHLVLLQCTGTTAFYRNMVKGQIRAIRLRKEDGSFYPEMLGDLRLYLREWRAWRRRLLRINRIIAATARETVAAE